MRGLNWRIARPMRLFAAIGTMAACAFPSIAQTTAPADLAARRQEALAAEARLPAPKAERTITFDLAPARQERLQRFLPNTWRILNRREPLHILALGDSVFAVADEPGSGSGQLALSLRAFPAVFAREVAAQFYYTGGVVEAGAIPTSAAALAPTVTLRQLSRPGGGVLDAAPILATTARQSPAHVLLLCYGHDDAAVMSPARFRRAIEDALDAARAMKLEVIVCSPFPAMAARGETSLGINRPFASMLKQIAEAEGILHVDLGDLEPLLRLPPDATDEAHRFEAIMRAYGAFFREPSPGTFVPRATLHDRLGSRIFAELLDAPPPPPWRIAALSATLQSSDRLTLRYEIHNTGRDAKQFLVYPLITKRWKPVAASPLIDVAAAGRQSLQIDFAGDPATAASNDQAEACLPLLATAGDRVRLEDVRAPVQPVAILWGTETFFNHEGPISPACQIFNNGEKTVHGTWRATFGSATHQGDFEAAPDSGTPLDLRLELPADVAKRQVIPIKLVVTCAGVDLASEAAVEIIPNLGLENAVALAELPSGDATGSDVTLKAEADTGMLFLTCELRGADLLADQPQTGPAWQMAVNLDARSYGKRLNQGTTAALRATGSAADGAGRTHEIPPWAFGNEYAAVFDPAKIITNLASTTQGTRAITMAIPRSYLYLHEWALENGNSQLGINVRLMLHHPPQAGGTAFRTFVLSASTKPPDDVDALAVLELTSEPTRRVTVNIYQPFPP